MGHAVKLVATSPENRIKTRETTVDDFTLIESPDLLSGIGRTGWDVWNTLRRIYYLHGDSFDVIHAVDTRPAVILPALFLRRKNGGVLIADWTDWYGRGGTTSERSGWLVNKIMGPIELFFEEFPRPWADGTMTISTALFNRALALGISEDSMIKFLPGSDTDRIKPKSRENACNNIGMDPGELRIGYLGNIYQKDADLLFSAVEKVREQLPGCQLVMVGRSNVLIPGGAIESGWLIRTGHISFSDLLDYLSACDVLILPLTDSIANRGRWPSKINDYMASARPIVATNVGDVGDLYCTDNIGRLAKPTIDDLSDKILDVLLMSPQDRKRMGDNARILADKEYSWEKTGAQLEKFYLRIIQRVSG